jgi:hypothetical protein
MKMEQKGLSTTAIVTIVVTVIVVVGGVAAVLLLKLGLPMTPGATTTTTPSITTTTTTTTPTTSSTTTTTPTTTITTSPTTATTPTETTTTTEFNGPICTRDLGGGSRLELWPQMRIKIIGPAAWNVDILVLTVTNSSGENVYEMAYWLPHVTLAPGESPPQEYDVDWIGWDRTSNLTTGKVEITPGIYTFTIVPVGFGENMGVTGTVEVTTGSGPTSTPPTTTTTTITLPPSSMITPYKNASDIASINEAYSTSANCPWGFAHNGIDFFPAGDNKPFQAVFSGVVTMVNLWQNDKTSNWQVNVTLEFNSSFSAVYIFEIFSQNVADGQTQLSNILVSVGQSVSQGDVIGRLYVVGSGAHVHFGLMENENAISPEPYFTQDAKNSILEILHRTFPGANMSYP